MHKKLYCIKIGTIPTPRPPMSMKEYGGYIIYFQKPWAEKRLKALRAKGIECDLYEATLNWNKVGD